MSGSLNRVTLIGNLGRDPEVRSTQSGGRIANFTVATSERWKDRNGERQERTEWHRIAVFNDALVGVVEQYLRKGSKVAVIGQLETRKWTDQGGQERYTTEVVLRPYRGELTMLDGRGEGGGGGYGGSGGGDYESYYGDSQGGGAQGRGSQGGGSGGGLGPGSDPGDLDDEIPF